MINIVLTEAGEDAVASNRQVSITEFIAGSGTTLLDMKTWHSDPSHYSGTSTFQTFPVNYTTLYLKGKTYVIEGKAVTVDYNALLAVGSLDTSTAPKSYVMKSVGIIATPEDDGISFVYAFGTLGTDSPSYPVQAKDCLNYVFPVKVYYDKTPNVTVNETSVPWKDFLSHALNSVGNDDTKPLPPHGVYIDKTNKKLYVDGTEIPLGMSTALEARLKALEDTYISCLSGSIEGKVMAIYGTTREASPSLLAEDTLETAVTYEQADKKSTVYVLTGSITVSEWKTATSSAQKPFANVMASSQVAIIPNQQAMDCGITVMATQGYLTFTYATKPTATYSFTVLTVNSPSTGV